MIQCIYNPNILFIISKYLPIKDVISLSTLNKTVYKKFDPEQHSQLNSLYCIEFIRLYYDDDVKRNILLDDYNNKNSYENLLVDFKETKKNWKKMSNQLYIHLQSSPNLEYGKLIYDFYKDHLYLPDLRKDSKYLEFKSSSMHQKCCYDMLLNFIINRNYYAKFFEPENKNEQIIPRSKNLPLADELINFKAFVNDFQNSNEYKEIILKLINYDFDSLNDIFNKNKYENKFIQLILWINSTIIIFVKVLYDFVLINYKPKNEKKFLVEFIKKHDDFINFALLLNKKFENINIIVNLINSYIITPKKKANFTLYKLCINIFKYYFYNNINKKLLEKFDIFVKNYFNSEFEKISELMKNGNLCNNEQFFDDDIEISNEDENELNMSCEEDLYSDKDVIEGTINHILDMEINENNAHLINHTDIKLSVIYKSFEAIVIENFKNEIIKYLKEEKPLSIIYRLVKYFIILDDNFMPLDEENPLSLIRRTKFLMLQESIKIFVDYIGSNLYSNFENYMKNLGEKFNCGKYGLDNETLNYLSKTSKNKCIENYEKDVNKIKDLLTNRYKNHGEAINQYMDSNCNEFICFMKNIVAFYFTQLGVYNDRNEIVVDLIKNGSGVKNTKCLVEDLEKEKNSELSKNESKNKNTGNLGLEY